MQEKVFLFTRFLKNGFLRDGFQPNANVNLNTFDMSPWQQQHLINPIQTNALF